MTRWFHRLVLAGVLLGLTVIVLGAYVRLTAAGLGCPDWPGCYGHATPAGALQSATARATYATQPLDVGKAWREMIHRYAAATLGLIILAIAILSVAAPGDRPVGPTFAAALLATVVFQGLLGMLTVTWRLKPLIVTAHLVFGMTTLGMLWWLWMSLSPAPIQQPPRSVSAAAAAGRVAWRLALIGVCVLGAQIALGGWTSSHYAAIACPDFPKCQGAWWPAADFRSAFVLWHGLDINYEGGVLASAARVAIHLTHRLGALTVALVLGAASLMAMTQASAHVRRWGALTLGALIVQLTIGIGMVVRGFPLWLATAHTAGAALLLLAALGLLRRLSIPRLGNPSARLRTDGKSSPPGGSVMASVQARAARAPIGPPIR